MAQFMDAQTGKKGTTAVQLLEAHPRGRRTSDAEAWADAGDALLDWLLKIVSKHTQEDALPLFLKKVREERIRKRSVQWAYGRASGSADALAVIARGIKTLDRARPPHWG
jgi:hypothetical protein